APAQSPITVTDHPFEFIDTSFENASPVWYEFAPDGTVLIHLLYDHERSSPNRAAGHIHFQLHAKPGSRLTLEFRNLDNVWNGVSGSIARELKAVVISEDGRAWKSVPLERDRKSTRLNSSHLGISYAVFCLKKKKITIEYKDPYQTHCEYAVHLYTPLRLSLQLLLDRNLKRSFVTQTR